MVITLKNTSYQSDSIEEPFFGSLENFQSRVGVKHILKNVVCNGNCQWMLKVRHGAIHANK